MESTKKCKQCGEEKVITDFYMSNKVSRMARCKQCVSLIRKKKYHSVTTGRVVVDKEPEPDYLLYPDEVFRPVERMRAIRTGEIFDADAGMYEISNYGRLLRLRGNILLKERIYKAKGARQEGERHVNLLVRHGDELHRAFKVAELVLLNFSRVTPDPKWTVYYIDGSHANNALENIQWATFNTRILDNLIPQNDLKLRMRKDFYFTRLPFVDYYTDARGVLKMDGEDYIYMFSKKQKDVEAAIVRARRTLLFSRSRTPDNIFRLADTFRLQSADRDEFHRIVDEKPIKESK